MDISKYWKQQIAQWNQESKCGFCWEYHNPLSDANANQQRFENPCCVQVLLTDLSFRYVPTHNKYGYVTGTKCVYDFTLKIVKHAEYGTNAGDEIPQHPEEESLYETIWNPLSSCLSCEPFLDFCRIIGNINVRITKWRGTLVRKYLDENMYGWQINATFEI